MAVEKFSFGKLIFRLLFFEFLGRICEPTMNADSSTGGEDVKVQSESSRHITDRQRGSTPAPRTKFRWKEELRCNTGVYVRRWYIETRWFSVRIHHWLHSDDDRNFHDHPWWFLTFVLQGGYKDFTPSGVEELRAGMLRYRPALHRHTVKVNSGGCWTILVTGPKVRKWGFWVGRKFRKSNKYFLEWGKHICD